MKPKLKQKKALWAKAFPEQVEPATSLRTRLMEQYRAKVRLWLFRSPNSVCIFAGCKKTAEVHHSRGRLGPLLLDERFWIPVCRTHHRWIHDHPEAARADGFLAHIGEFNTPGDPEK